MLTDTFITDYKLSFNRAWECRPATAAGCPSWERMRLQSCPNLNNGIHGPNSSWLHQAQFANKWSQRMRVQDISHNLSVHPLTPASSLLPHCYFDTAKSSTPVPPNEGSVTLSRHLPAQRSKCHCSAQSDLYQLGQKSPTCWKPPVERCALAPGHSPLLFLVFISLAKMCSWRTCCVFVKLSSQGHREELWPPWDSLHLT